MSATDSYLLLRALVDELVRCGMEHACTCPGSRNAPIVLTLAREPRLRTWSHIDERSAGFFALGAAKASGRPVAVTCTSGTAAANLAPAVIEAHQARIPLIVLSADRPAELREVGAGQTIDQVKLYGDAAKWFFELDLGSASPERLRWMRTLADRAYFTAVDGRSGPVHLNVPLREPLVLDAPLGAEPGGGGRGDGSPWVRIDRPASGAGTPERHAFDRTVFVAGGLGGDRAAGRRLADLATRARVPLLADPLSGARRGDAAIAHYDLFLRDPDTARELQPQVVARIGELPTSKPLRAWLAGLDIPQIGFGGDESWPDPDSRLSARTVTALGPMLERIEADEIVADTSDWLDRWRGVDVAASQAVEAVLDDSGLSEPAVAAALGRELPAEATLFVGSSMPIRDVEAFFPVVGDPPRVLSNRGANGIDGTVSSAYGVAAVSRGPVVLLIGDVALAHDLGGLMAARRTGLSLTVVLLNNDGGGIFHFLPVAGEQDAFEEHVATPHGLDFAAAATLYGCDYELVGTLEELMRALSAALAAGGTTIVEARSDRSGNRALHHRLEQSVRARLAGRSF
jgi:2-succinyl-5-enolpyruvyl-6-hydroxy-3-cyclohexene-1-carboxylate synthase